jgi:putative transposase
MRERGGSMTSVESLSHTRWDCKYHLVWVPKCRRKVLYAQLLKHLGQVLHDLAGQNESKILEGHLQADHVHMPVSIPPKEAFAQPTANFLFLPVRSINNLLIFLFKYQNNKL